MAELKFNNVDAELYGFDIEANYAIDSHWSVNTVVNYVRGKRDDISDDLYRIAPLNGVIGLTYQNSLWAATVESVLVDEQDKVSETNNEQETPGYGLINLKGHWQANANVRIGAGIDNVFDKRYFDHLGGYNRVVNPDIAVDDRLPGYGRNVFARIDYQW